RQAPQGPRQAIRQRIGLRSCRQAQGGGAPDRIPEAAAPDGQIDHLPSHHRRPFLMAYPNAGLLNLSKYGLEPLTLEETDHYRLIREFCANPRGLHRLDDGGLKRCLSGCRSGNCFTTSIVILSCTSEIKSAISPRIFILSSRSSISREAVPSFSIAASTSFSAAIIFSAASRFIYLSPVSSIIRLQLTARPAERKNPLRPPLPCD